MNVDLQQRLRECGVTVTRLSKSEKVKILTRWNKEFPNLHAAARHGQDVASVASDATADAKYDNLHDEEYFVLPDDPSGMPSYRCQSDAMPNLLELVSDTVTRCDELVIVASDFRWSAVLVNHGSPQLVARYFSARPDP